MNMPNDPEFKIPIDDVNPDELLKDELLKKEISQIRKEQRSQRNSFLIFVILIVIGMVVFVYFDISKRVKTISSEKTSQVEHLSSDLDSRFSTLSIQYAKFEENFTNQLKALDQKFAKTNVSSAQLSDDLEAMGRTAGKLKAEVDKLKKQKADAIDMIAGQEDLAAAVSDAEKAVDEKLSPIRTDVKNIGALVSSFTKSMEDFKNRLLNETIDIKINEKYQKDFTDLKNTVDSVTSNLILMESELNKLSEMTAEKTDKSFIETALINNDKTIKKVGRDVDERISLLTDRLKAVEKELKDIKAAGSAKKGGNRGTTGAAASDNDPKAKPVSPGKIIENDINQ